MNLLNSSPENSVEWESRQPGEAIDGIEKIICYSTIARTDTYKALICREYRGFEHCRVDNVNIGWIGEMKTVA